ncbi:MAG: FMN-dependent NADH-azoreductase [Anaerotignaceae bacterium]
MVVNSCVRGKEKSRSKRIADAFLTQIKAVDGEAHITEVDLMQINPPYMTYLNFEQREKLIEEQNFQSPIFSLAKQFSAADRIVIAAPFWEYSFPAILKAYIENVSVCGITFAYNEKGSVGLCKAKKMMYITTRGGIVCNSQDEWLENGARYLKAMCNMYGIKEFDVIDAQGLDIWGVDTQELVSQAINTAKTKATEFLT